MPVRDFWDREEPTVVGEATVGRVAKSQKTMSRQKVVERSNHGLELGECGGKVLENLAGDDLGCGQACPCTLGVRPMPVDDGVLPPEQAGRRDGASGD